MVLANALCAMNLAASMIVNGLCCYYQMNEENERRKEQQAAIETAIRNELDLHRREEMVAKRDELIKAHKDSVGLRLQNEARRKRMGQKASSMMRDVNKNNQRDQPIQNDGIELITMNTIQPMIVSDNYWSTFVESEVCYPLKVCEERRIPSNLMKVRENTRSLFDSSFDDDDNDFEEICIE